MSVKIEIGQRVSVKNALQDYEVETIHDLKWGDKHQTTSVDAFDLDAMTGRWEFTLKAPKGRASVRVRATQLKIL